MTLLLISLGMFFWIALIVLYVLAFPLMVAHVANNQGRSGAGWFFLSLLISPVFAILVLIALGDTDEKRKQRAILDEQARNRVREEFAKRPPDNSILQQRLEQSRNS